ncbi:MAG: UbiH/UbiF/VisC/COQ6 family ubiquinone biosynthesis hydroxylase [Cellvibrionaceae bacterium]
MKDEYEKADITIIGAGLVGAVLALTIASAPENQSLSVTVIDQGAEPKAPDINASSPTFDPRVVALTHASVELLKSIDVWSSVLEQRVCFYRHMTVWDDEGTAEIQFDAKELNQESLGVIVENSLLLTTVLSKLTTFNNVKIIRKQSIEAIEPLAEKKGKRVVLSNGDKIQTSLLLAADGGFSKVRELLGFPVRCWDYAHKAIVATVKSERVHQYTARQNFLTTGPLAFLPLGEASEKYCSIVWSVESERADQLMALSVEEFEQALEKAFEYRTGKVKVADKRYCFPLIQRHAVEYIAPQVALVGDAAHTIHPLAGQGVNLGLLDASVLAQEIRRASQRNLLLTDESILRRYQRQRKRNNLEIMLLMESFKRLFGSRQLAVRWLRNSGIKALNKVGPIKNWLARQAMGL